MRNSLTSSERRGAVILAIISLIVIGVAFIIPSVMPDKSKPIDSTEVEILVRGDTVSSVKEKTKEKKSTPKKTKTKKTYRQRSPLDEPVGKL